MFNGRGLVLPLVLTGCLFAARNYAREIPGDPDGGSSQAQAPSGPTPSAAAKSTHYIASGLRAGAIKTSNGWNLKDFAASIMNPNSVEITVTWKLISDDSKFAFRDGSLGTWTQTFKIPPMSSGTFNVYCPQVAEVHIPTVTVCAVPALTNFKGSTEFSSSLPFYAYSGHEFETGEATNADPDRAWYDAWDAWQDAVPVIWDPDLQQFVVPYTNFWHNVKDYPVGWHSTLSIKNNSGQRVSYLIQHKPIWGAFKDPTSGCREEDMSDQTFPLVLDKGQELNTSLEGLFGWPSNETSAMEGIILIRPTPITAAAQTSISSWVGPNSFGTSGCVDSPLISVMITSPVAKVEGTVNVAASAVGTTGIPIDKVEFYVDGKLSSTGTSSPYEFKWDTTAVSNGHHALTAVAYAHEAGTDSHTVNVTVSNPSPR